MGWAILGSGEVSASLPGPRVEGAAHPNSPPPPAEMEAVEDGPPKDPQDFEANPEDGLGGTKELPKSPPPADDGVEEANPPNPDPLAAKQALGRGLTDPLPNKAPPVDGFAVDVVPTDPNKPPG